MTTRAEIIRKCVEILQPTIDNIEVKSNTDVCSLALKTLVDYAMESERKTISPIENGLSQYEEKLRMAREEAETLYYCEHRGEEGYE